MHEIELSDEQERCIAHCLDKERRLAAVTGEAGTGKTTLIRYIAERLQTSVATVAPTGKAAKRIREATGVQAITIHKLLEYGRPRERDQKTGEPLDPTIPKRGRDNPIDQGVVLCDEYSMVSHELNRNLIDALPRGGRLVMFGDVSQLSPIEKYPLKNPDSPFVQHLGENGRAFTLTEVYRQAQESDVLRAAHAIRRGIIPRRGDKFKLNLTNEPVKSLKQLINGHIDYSKMENQIITPVKTRWIGTGALNVMLRNIYNPRGKDAVQLLRYKWDEKRPVTISVGDKVVCTENTYDLRDYNERFTEFKEDGKAVYQSFIPTPDTKYMLNGETGVVIAIYPDTTIEIDFGDRVVELPFEYEEWSERNGTYFPQYPQRAIELAYAITTHKAQGSEYDNVIYVMNKSASYMLARENFYTAITRARESAQVVTDSAALTTSLRVTREIVSKRTLARAKEAKKLVKGMRHD